MLIDCEICLRTFAKRAEGTGARLDDIREICLTHLDRDHISLNWLETIVARQIPIFCDERRVMELKSQVYGEDEFIAAFEKLISPFNGHPFSPMDGIQIRSIPLQHDRMGSHGFLIEGFGAKVGYATDLGRVPRRLVERFCELDILAIESNYDPEMQMKSPRPWYLKDRIMGGAGHLSNAQAMAAIREILDTCETQALAMPAHIVLLHRSRECNCPKLLPRCIAPIHASKNG